MKYYDRTIHKNEAITKYKPKNISITRVQPSFRKIVKTDDTAAKYLTHDLCSYQHKFEDRLLMDG